jgi:hypothetical protein
MGCAFAGGNDAVKTLGVGVEESLLQTSENPYLGASGSNEIAQRAGNMVRRGKRPAQGTARAEHAMDGGFCVFPI